MALIIQSRVEWVFMRLVRTDDRRLDSNSLYHLLRFGVCYSLVNNFLEGPSLGTRISLLFVSILSSAAASRLEMPAGVAPGLRKGLPAIIFRLS